MNSIICGDNRKVLNKIKSNSIHLTVTSPPYDKMRNYGDGDWDIVEAGKELYRITVDGGICVMVMQDATVDGAKTLTTFTTAVDMCKLGWRLFECCIYSRNGVPGGYWTKRFRVDHEYVMIFLKGRRPRFFSKKHIMVPCKNAGKLCGGGTRRQRNGLISLPKIVINPTKCRGSIWHYSTSSSEKNKLKKKHPATYPDKLASDIIKCFTKKGDVVLDPFVGSGTTCAMAAANGRRYIGIDSNKEYCKLARKIVKMI